MKTSKIIFISLLSFIGIFLLAFLIIGIVFKEDAMRIAVKSRSFKGKIIMIEKPFKHVVIKSDMFYEVKNKKQSGVKDAKKDDSSFTGDDENRSIPNPGLWDEARLQKANKLPKSFYGEWYQKEGKMEYNGMIIHPDFMEHFYQACPYDIIKKGDYSYNITIKCENGFATTYNIQQIEKDVIRVVRPGGDISFFYKVDTPPNGIRVQLEDLPKQLRKKWYTTHGTNSIEFDFTGDELIFKGSKYRIEDIILFLEKWGKQYRIIAKNSMGKTMMFYFKNWSDWYCRVAYFGKNGDFYKSSPAYPNPLYHKSKGFVSISQGKIRELIYYNLIEVDSLNHPVIRVKNDTLYLNTNKNLAVNLFLSQKDSLLSISGNNCAIRASIYKLPFLNISLENSELIINNPIANMNIDTIRLNINHSRITKSIKGGSAVFIGGTIGNNSDVTLPKAYQLQLDVDKTSYVQFW